MKIGLIGYGAWGCSQSEKSRQAAPINCASPLTPTTVSLLALPEPDAVDIVLPTHLHREVASAALEAGKHVLLEKPMTANRADCRALIDLARTSGKILYIGHELRHSTQWGRMSSLIEEGEVGTAQYATIDIWRRPSSPPGLWDNLSAIVNFESGAHLTAPNRSRRPNIICRRRWWARLAPRSPFGTARWIAPSIPPASKQIIQFIPMLKRMRTLLLTALLCAGATAQVRYEDILKGPGKDWLTYSGSFGGWRHSPLEQITAKNARMLSPQWVYHVPDARALRTSPLVYKGVMYVTNSNSVYALDARTGRLVWQYLDARAKDKKVNRGAAILGERVYFTTSDNYLTALDRQTGVVIFSRKFADAEKGVGSTSAPFIAKDKVIVGSAGGDSGMRGFVAALSAETGEEMWRTYTVPAKGEPGAESWGDFIEWGGGATWLSGTFDPELNTLYWTTGNPWPDFTGKPRQGDNLYTCSLVALDLDTGKMKWYFQFTPHDTHDWDAQSWPILIDMEWKGKMRKVVLHANRNGFFYVLDRVTGEFLRATKLIDNLTWASGVDDKGRPIPVPGKDPTPEGNWVCPSVKGATNWMGQTYHPGTGLLYVITLEQCGMYNSSSQEPVPMKNFPGGGATEEGGQVILRAIDPKTGKRAWEYPMTGFGRMWSGTVSTAGGVIFTGDDASHMVALDARTGKHLWHFNVGEGLTASPITYEVNGKQYVAIASATAIFSFGLFEPAQP